MATLMTDRELIELAAQAAGIDLAWSSQHDLSPRRSDSFDIWNPLEYNSDAFLLAIDLSIDVAQAPPFKEAHAIYYCHGFVLDQRLSEPWGTDKYAANRRAIVRAAVAIIQARINHTPDRSL